MSDDIIEFDIGDGNIYLWDRKAYESQVKWMEHREQIAFLCFGGYTEEEAEKIIAERNKD